MASNLQKLALGVTLITLAGLGGEGIASSVNSSLSNDLCIVTNPYDLAQICVDIENFTLPPGVFVSNTLEDLMDQLDAAGFDSSEIPLSIDHPLFLETINGTLAINSQWPNIIEVKYYGVSFLLYTTVIGSIINPYNGMPFEVTGTVNNPYNVGDKITVLLNGNSNVYPPFAGSQTALTKLGYFILNLGVPGTDSLANIERLRMIHATGLYDRPVVTTIESSYSSLEHLHFPVSGYFIDERLIITTYRESGRLLYDPPFKNYFASQQFRDNIREGLVAEGIIPEFFLPNRYSNGEFLSINIGGVDVQISLQDMAGKLIQHFPLHYPDGGSIFFAADSGQVFTRGLEESSDMQLERLVAPQFPDNVDQYDIVIFSGLPEVYIEYDEGSSISELPVVVDPASNLARLWGRINYINQDLSFLADQYAELNGINDIVILQPTFYDLYLRQIIQSVQNSDMSDRDIILEALSSIDPIRAAAEFQAQLELSGVRVINLHYPIQDFVARYPAIRLFEYDDSGKHYSVYGQALISSILEQEIARMNLLDVNQ